MAHPTTHPLVVMIIASVPTAAEWFVWAPLSVMLLRARRAPPATATTAGASFPIAPRYSSSAKRTVVAFWIKIVVSDTVVGARRIFPPLRSAGSTVPVGPAPEMLK